MDEAADDDAPADVDPGGVANDWPLGLVLKLEDVDFGVMDEPWESHHILKASNNLPRAREGDGASTRRGKPVDLRTHRHLQRRAAQLSPEKARRKLASDALSGCIKCSALFSELEAAQRAPLAVGLQRQNCMKQIGQTSTSASRGAGSPMKGGLQR